MRLLTSDGNGGFSLTEDFTNNPHQYAILSHTWRTDGGEVTYKDMMEDTAEGKPGYMKIRFCGEHAARDGLQYFWVDSCCIDKSNSTELNEAINSMFRWYENAHKCYVYLSDVPAPGVDNDAEYYQQAWKTCFRKSRWFTRGWTLQEMLAPTKVEFFSKDGEPLGSKKSLEWQIHEITGIPIRVLQGQHLAHFSVEERLSWAEARETTREEDKFYSLLGIFGVVMPLIYGEGRRNAFKRLRHEINRSSRNIPQAGVAQETVRSNMQNDALMVKLDQSGEEVGINHHFDKFFEKKHSEQGVMKSEGVVGESRAYSKCSFVLLDKIESKLVLGMSSDKIPRDSKLHQHWFPPLSKVRWLSLIMLVLFLLVIMAAFILNVENTPYVLDIPAPIWNSTWPVFAVIGRIGAGKSSFIKTLGGQHVYTMEFPIIADSSDPCTVQLLWYKAIVDGKPMYLMDTPGFDDEHLDDKNILEMIWNDFKGHASMKDRHLTGIIFLHNVAQTGVGGAIAESMDELQNLLGHDDFYRLALVTTKWTNNVDQRERDNLVEREQHNEFIKDQWRDLMKAGAEVIRFDGTLPSATTIIKRLLINRDKKRWDKPRTGPQLSNLLTDMAATHTLSQSTAELTTTTRDTSLKPTSKLLMTPETPRSNWIAQIVKQSLVARAIYMLILISIYVILIIRPELNIQYGDEPAAPVLLTQIITTWLVYDAFATAGNGSSAAVLFICFIWVSYLGRRILTAKPSWRVYNKGEPSTSETITSAPICVILSCVATYTLYDWILNIP